MPVEVESGELRLYRHVRASDIKQVPIPAGKFAMLELPGCFDAAGLWQVMLDLNCENGDRFLHSQELKVDLEAGGQESGDKSDVASG